MSMAGVILHNCRACGAILNRVWNNLPFKRAYDPLVDQIIEEGVMTGERGNFG
jgi:hypothetical protein